MLIEDDAALILLEILSKFSEELCLSRDDAEIVWDGGDFYLDKMCGDFAKINDSDYVRLISKLEDN